MSVRKTSVIVFAGPNGSGKSTVTDMVEKVGDYINADDIKRIVGCSDLDAANMAERMRKDCIIKHKDFTFETVLSTPRNLELLRSAKENDYFIRCYYVLTTSADINVARVATRVSNGGHGVPEDKIRARYKRALGLLPELIDVCDICNVYDNTETPFRIFSKKLATFRLWENDFWSKNEIINLTGKIYYDQIYTIQSGVRERSVSDIKVF